MKSFKFNISNVVKWSILVFAILVANYNWASNGDWERIVNLKGYWRFQVGDNQDWSGEHYNDRNWEKVYAPAYWEDEGFRRYSGHAWYRKKFDLEEIDSRNLYLFLGYIDDVDEVYLNGHLIGSSGSFPPQYATAYNLLRRYLVPKKYLNTGANTLAVRVFDEGGPGGIIGRRIGIYATEHTLPPNIDLTGTWKFHLFDDSRWKDPEFDDSEWEDIMVPRIWEDQGFYGYNGFAWYRRRVLIPKSFEGGEFVLSLGKIDDLDEVFVNGKRVGATGDIDRYRVRGFEWQEVRGYFLPANALRPGEENVIAVRVYDRSGDGGIHQGPVGIFTREDYTAHWRHNDWDRGSFWRYFDHHHWNNREHW